MRRRWLTLLLPLLLLAGCVSVPFSGAVDDAGTLDADIDVDFDFLPSGPVEGATQEEILRGFLAATTASQNNYRIARSFLADSVADSWNPYAGTLVRSRDGSVERVDDVTLTYSVPIVASVDPVGRYAVADTQASQTLPPFRFVQQDGQWRIAQLGDGILISQQAFPSAFGQHTLYYWDAAFRNLVPDLRWFPSRSEVATRIVRALLESPTSWLGQGATVSAIPEGTELALAPVSIENGIAQVDLTSEVLALSDRERQQLKLQLVASLRAVSGVVGVEITVDQNLITIPEWTTGVPEIVPQVDPRLLVRTDDAFGFSTGGAVEPIGALSQRVIDVGATAVTLAPGRTLAAVLAPDGVWAITSGDAQPTLLDRRAALIAPSIDGAQFVWTVPADNPAAIRAIELDGTVHPVEAELPEGRRIVTLAVSRDDTRIVLMLDGVGGPRLVVAAVIRDEGSGVPIRLGELRDLPINGETAVAAAWVDEIRVASITSIDGQTLVEVHEIGGRTRALGLPQDAVQIVGGNGGVDGIRVRDADGLVLEPRGSGWQGTGLRASFLGVQQ